MIVDFDQLGLGRLGRFHDLFNFHVGHVLYFFQLIDHLFELGIPNEFCQLCGAVYGEGYENVIHGKFIVVFGVVKDFLAENQVKRNISGACVLLVKHVGKIEIGKDLGRSGGGEVIHIR